MAMHRHLYLLRRLVEIGYTMLIIVLLSVIVGLILAFPVMWLWNFIVGKFCIADAAGTCTSYLSLRINVFQAWALNILAGILFGKTSDPAKK